MARTTCRNCDEPLPENSDPRRRYCSDRCRVAFSRHMKSIEPLKGKGGRHTPEHIAKARQLAFGNLEDEVREVMRDEIRKTVTQAVKDNVLGAAEVMTHLLPSVLAGLADDVKSEDWMVRSRAQAIILKYAMPFGEEKAEKDDLRIVNVIHNVPIPDSNLGRAIEGELVAIEGRETFENDWPECHYCNEVKHPDTGGWQSGGDGDQAERWVCKSCEVRKAIKRGQATPDGFLRDGLYG